MLATDKQFAKVGKILIDIADIGCETKVKTEYDEVVIEVKYNDNTRFIIEIDEDGKTYSYTVCHSIVDEVFFNENYNWEKLIKDSFYELYEGGL